MISRLCLTHDELVEITGLKKFSAQLRWLRKEGFVVKRRADGMPLVSRAHFESMMGVVLSQQNNIYQEPDFSSLR